MADRATIYEAAHEWRQQCLLADGSILSAAPIWTAEHAAELTRHFVEKPDESDRSFEDKLKDQLSQVSPGGVQLAAEMLWVMMLFPSNISRDRKIELVGTVWKWSGGPFADRHPALGALDTGIGSGGPGYNNYRPFEMQLLVRFTAGWKTLEPGERRRLADDGWAFADWFDRLPDGPSRQLRHMLLHMLFPEEFERISSTNDKKRIDKAFARTIQGLDLPLDERAPTALARDRRIRRLRQQLELEQPGQVLDFYDTPDLERRWRINNAPPVPGSKAKGKGTGESPPPPYRPVGRVWVIGAGEGATRWPIFHEQGNVAIGWEELGDLRQYEKREDVHAAMKRVYEKDNDPWNDTLACWQFCREMAVGDFVYVKQGRNRVLGYGRISSEYEYDLARADYRNVRAVEWLRRGNWTLPDSAQVPPKTLTDVTAFPEFREFMQQQIGEAVVPIDDSPTPYAIDDVMTDAFLSREAVEQILSSLRRRKNVILQGPPGVGKSFLARRLGYALVGAKAPDNVQMVQFHQSYAYEDFIQGWRPNGARGFALRNGVFYEFCQRARSRPGEPHVFIIDEINRGNLSKVFGELMMLIETDKRGAEFAIPLTYSESRSDTFFIPDNLYIVGLMNTADRSLAMVDYALRRRFAFWSLDPAFESPAFTRTLRDRGVDDETIALIVDRVGTVNAEIVGDHKNLGAGFAIGHSYFCPVAHVDDSQRWYESVVREELEPLLAEYWFDDERRVERCVAILRG